MKGSIISCVFPSLPAIYNGVNFLPLIQRFRDVDDGRPFLKPFLPFFFLHFLSRFFFHFSSFFFLVLFFRRFLRFYFRTAAESGDYARFESIMPYMNSPFGVLYEFVVLFPI